MTIFYSSSSTWNQIFSSVLPTMNDWLKNYAEYGNKNFKFFSLSAAVPEKLKTRAADHDTTRLLMMKRKLFSNLRFFSFSCLAISDYERRDGIFSWRNEKADTLLKSKKPSNVTATSTSLKNF